MQNKKTFNIGFMWKYLATCFDLETQKSISRKETPADAAGDFGLFASHEGHAACGPDSGQAISAILGWEPQDAPGMVRMGHRWW